MTAQSQWTYRILHVALFVALALAAQTPASAQDCNNNGVPDTQDIDPADPDGNGEVSADCDMNAVPDECQPDCNGNGIADPCDLPTNNVVLAASDGSGDDYFGSDVDTDGDTVIVGAPSHPDGGAAFVYRRTGGVWQEIAKLRPDDPEIAGLQFALRVAISGDTAVVTAPYDDELINNSGAVYVFREIGGVWQQVDKIKALNPEMGNAIDGALSLDGDTLAVHGRAFDDGAPTIDAVYIFRETGGVWDQIATIQPDELLFADRFGTSLALSGQTLIVGSPRRSEHDQLSGTAYIFRETVGQWIQVAELTGPAIERSSYFGQGVAIEGDTAVVGAPGDYPSTLFRGGEAHVFREIDGEWRHVAMLDQDLEPPFINSVPFGVTVATQGGWVFVGGGNSVVAPGVPGIRAVAAFREVNGSWERLAHFDRNTTSIVNDPPWLAASSSLLVYGTFRGGLTPIQGFINVVNIAGQDCNNNSVPDECELSGNDCDANGIPDECDNDCNDDGIPDACEIADCPMGDTACADCNGNGIPDECDPDCDADGIPDDCEIADCPPEDPTCADCNENGIPDECDEDCNANGIPDTCEISTKRATLEPENSNTFDRFGSSVAFDGDTVVVGDAADFNLIYDVGSATVFERSNGQWMRIARLTNPQNPDATRFGKSVAISGGLMLVGANEDVVDGSHSGAVYAYERINGKWQFTERLIAGDPSSDNFGYSLCMEGDTAIVGSKGDDEFGDASGAAFVFRRINDAWQQVAKLSAQDAAEGDQFGFSVAMSGDLAVIGAPFDDDVASNCGAVYVFRETNGVWAQIAKLLGTDLSANNQFGISVAVDADTIVASTFHFQKIHFHIFETTGNGWEQTGFRQGKGGGLLDFENSVAIHNGRVVVAEARFRHYITVGHISYTISLRALVVYEKLDDVWQRTALLVPELPSSQGVFGHAVAIQGDEVVFSNTDTRTANVFHLANLATDCEGNEVIDDCQIANCTQPSLACSSCQGTDTLTVCAILFNDCDGNGAYDYCETLSYDSLAEFVTAVLDGSFDDVDLCSYDLDRNGLLDGRDIARFVDNVLGG